MIKVCSRCGNTITNQYKDNYISHWSKQSQKEMFFRLCDECRVKVEQQLKKTGVI